jgi:hypothetical protein
MPTKRPIDLPVAAKCVERDIIYSQCRAHGPYQFREHALCNWLLLHDVFILIYTYENNH